MDRRDRGDVGILGLDLDMDRRDWGDVRLYIGGVVGDIGLYDGVIYCGNGGGVFGIK